MAIKKKFPHRVATVYCNGGCHAAKKMDYQAASCEEAMQLCEGGPLECAYGCLGCGTCVAACIMEMTRPITMLTISIGPQRSRAIYSAL